MTNAIPKAPARPAWLDISLLLALISALLVTAGWAYGETWYARFDLGLMGLQIPPVYFGIYGFKTIKAHWWWLLPLVVGALVAWRLYSARLPIWATGWFGIASPALLLTLFWFAYSLGASVARGDYRDHAQSGFCAYPYVRLALDRTAKLPAPLKEIPDLAASQQLRLLLQTQDLIILIAPDPGSPPLIVPMGRVLMLRLIPVQAACRR